MFNVAAFALVEIPLVAYLVAPERTRMWVEAVEDVDPVGRRRRAALLAADRLSSCSWSGLQVFEAVLSHRGRGRLATRQPVTECQASAQGPVVPLRRKTVRLSAVFPVGINDAGGR